MGASQTVEKSKHQPEKEVEGPNNEALIRFYGGYQKLGGGAAYDGRKRGGLDETKVYSTSLMSAAKKHLIKDLARVLGHGLNIPEFKGETDLSKIIEKMKKLVPNPHPTKGNGKQWGADKDKQIKACGILAKAINERMGDIIDMKESPTEICHSVGEVMHALTSALSSELTVTRSDLERAMKNLHTLGEFIKNNFQVLEGKVNAAEDSTVRAETKIVREVQQELMKEHERQLAMLQLMLDVATPAEKDLVRVLEDSSDFKGLLRKITRDLGTREYGRKISYMLSGATTTAQAAKIVDDALTRIGMSYDEYKKASDVKSLKDLLSKKALDSLGQAEPALDLYEKAKDALLKYQYLHDDIVPLLRGVATKKTGSGEGGLFNPIAGGAAGVTGGLKVDKRVKRRQDLKKALVRDFNDRLHQLTSIILSASDRVATAIGDGKTEMSDAVGKFVKALEALPNLEREYTYFALTGAIDNIQARQEREKFVSAAKYIVSTIDDVLKEHKLPDLKDMRDAFSKIVELIEAYVAKFAEGFGPLASWETYSKELRGSLVETDAKDTARAAKGGEESAAPAFFNPIAGGDEEDEDKEGGLFNAIDGGELDSDEKEGGETTGLFNPIAGGEVPVGLFNPIAGGGEGGGWMSWLGFTPEQKTEAKKVTKALKETASSIAVKSIEAAGKAATAKIGRGEDSYLDSKDHVLGAGTTATMARVATDLKDATQKITYFHRIAVMRRGLSKASKEFKAYKEDYVKMLADAIAGARDKNAAAKNDFIERFKKDGELYKMFMIPLFAGNAAPEIAAYQAAQLAYNANPGDAGLKSARDLALDAALAKVDSGEKAKAAVKFDKMRQFGTSQYEAVDNLYKVAEAMDIYMKEFTDAISAHPDDVQNIISILDGTEVIAKWYDEGAGNVLAQVFDSFPGYCQAAAAGDVDRKFTNLNMPKNQLNDNHYYMRIATILNLATPAQLNDQGHSKKLKFIQGDAAAADLTGWLGRDGRAPGDAIDPSGRRLPGNPFLGTQVQYVANARKDANDYSSGVYALEQARKALKQVSSLKNLIAAFVNIGERFGGSELIKKTHISPKLMLQWLNEYIACSSFKLGQSTGNVQYTHGANLTQATRAAAIPVGGDNTFIDATSMRLGADSMRARRPNTVLDQTIIIMRGSPVEALMTGDIFESSDRIFQLIVKSMIAKILTVIGTFNMFQRPVNRSGLGYYSNLRMVLGGAEVPAVVPGAFELYVRLPLLAEFYRKIFKFETDKPETIAMIPEMDGTFSGLISIIFDKAKEVKDGNYSDTEVRALVEEINKIFARFKGSKSPVRDCIEEFVAEVNRRYGIVTREDSRRYIDEIRDRYKTKYDAPEDNVDFELKGIDEDDTFVRPSPSDQFRTVGSMPASGLKDHKHELRLDRDQELLRGLRNRIDKLFRKCTNRLGSPNELDELKNASFQSLINSKTLELSHATSDSQKYDIVRSSIASLGTFALSSLERSYLLFHDTVVSGLSALRLLYSHLHTYEERVRGIWREYDIHKKSVAAGKANNWAAAPAPPVGVVLRYVPATAVPANRQGNGAVPQATLYPAPANVNRDLYEEALLRFGLDQEKMFLDLFEAIFNHGETVSELIKVKIDVARTEDTLTLAAAPARSEYAHGQRKIAVHMDYSKLRECVYSLLNQIKGMIDRFRGLLPADVLKHYEEYVEDPVTGTFGVYWIEKHLVDELLEGKYAEESDKHNTLEGANRKISELLDYFTRPWKISGADITAGTLGDKTEYHTLPIVGYVLTNFKDVTYHQFDMRPIIYDNTGIAVVEVPPVPETNDLRRLLVNTSSKKKANTEIGGFWNAGITNSSSAYPFKPDKWVLAPDSRNLVVSFNKLLGAYLIQVYDDPSRSIYLPALNKFASGSFSASVIGDAWFDDGAGRATINFKDTPGARGVLFRSLAQMIKQLVSEKSSTGTELEFAKNDLAMIPNYVKERVRANLPVFHKLFTLLLRRSELAKKFVTSFNTELQRVTGEWAAYLNTETHKHYMYILDQITLGCQSLLQCIEDVLHDLADTPKYLETQQNSIKDYESVNGAEPFMPIASILNMHQDLVDAADAPFMPVHFLGHEQFKMLYGTRGVLSGARSTGLADLPGLARMLKQHNDTVDPRHHIAEKDVQQLAADFTTFMRYTLDARLYSQQLTTFDGAASRFDLRQNVVEPATGWVYQLKRQGSITSLTEVLRLTESNFQREERAKIVRFMEQGKDVIISGDRKQLIACNLVDLNIVPIDLHALMREMPLLMLYNYAYTFDRMIAEVLEVRDLYADSFERATISIGRGAGQADTPARMLAMLMMSPYNAIDEKAYEFLVSRIMRGAVGVEGLGRPKYLAEEMYNKALFGELYTSGTLRDAEVDPGHAQSRAEGIAETQFNYTTALAEINNIYGVSLPGGLSRNNIDDFLDLNLGGLSVDRKRAAIGAWLQTIYNAVGAAPTAVSTTNAVDKLLQMWNDRDAYKRRDRAQRPSSSAAVDSRSDLHFVDRDSKGKTDVKVIAVDGVKEILKVYGKLRFDTRLSRNLFWIANLQRLLRLKLRRDLTWYSSKVVSDHASMASSITETYDNDAPHNPSMFDYTY